MDLDAYCARVGYAGPREPTLGVLHALALHHTTAIPFENLDVLLGRGIPLQPDAIFRKLVLDRRGGYCFEQNNLLLQVLRALGFRVTPLGARVRWQLPRDTVPARTHLFLRVHLAEGDWLADVGLGGASLTAAIPYRFDERLETPHDDRRLVREDGRLFHQVWNGTEWCDVCEFSTEEMHPVDCEVANWWTSASPASHFRTGPILGRARRDGTRVALRGGELTVRRRGEVLTRLAVDGPDHLLAVLAAEFDLHFPPGTRFDPAA